MEGCCQVPEYKLGLVAGVRRDDDSLSCLTNELLELLRYGDDEKLSSTPTPPRPPSAPAAMTATNIAGSDLSGRQLIPSSAREAEMASWLCQLFEEASGGHEPGHAATTSTAEPEPGGSAAPPSSSTTTGHDVVVAAATGMSDDDAANNKAECCRGRHHRSRSWPSAGRAAEQRRRDKIKEKMRTLQQMVPWCKKTDKASTLEEVIRHVKFLQHQLQVLSNRFATPTATLPPAGVVPPPCMQPPPPRDVFGMQPLIMFPAQHFLPQYPFVIPATFARPRHGDGCVPLPPPPSPPPPPPLPPPFYHRPDATPQLLNHHRIIPDLAAAPSRRKAGSNARRN